MGVITFNNIASTTLGVEVETFPNYVAPQKDYEVVHIPGRNGDIMIDTGTYLNVPRTYKINVATRNLVTFTNKINAVAEWLHSASGYARLEDSYEPDYYRMAYYGGNVDIENLFNEAGQADIEFTCKPQRFLKSGETGITYTQTGTITNPTSHDALPILNIGVTNTKLENSDLVGEVHIGNYSFSIKFDNIRESGATYIMTVDCELQNAYTTLENMNNLIVLNDEELPKIEPGERAVGFSGNITSVEVIPRWWTI